MEIGIGLPNTLLDTPGDTIVEWARRAEARGFSSLATIDRIVYPGYDSIVVLAAAAGATERIRLMPNVLLGPTRDPVILAKEAASLDQVSRGRFILGVAVGGRKDDFDAVGASWSDRGKRWDEALETMHRAWKGEPVAGGEFAISPRPTNGDRVPVLIGGMADQSIERTLKWGIGWTAGGAPPQAVGPFAERVRKAWKESDRDGDPKIVALSYYSFGQEDVLATNIKSYYGYLGDMADQMVQWLPKDADSIRQTVKAFEEVGVDELILDPTVPDLEQVDRLADTIL